MDNQTGELVYYCRVYAPGGDEFLVYGVCENLPEPGDPIKNINFDDGCRRQHGYIVYSVTEHDHEVTGYHFVMAVIPVFFDLCAFDLN